MPSDLIKRLAAAARRKPKEAFNSVRRVDAFNLFLETTELLYPKHLKDNEDFDRYCLKATTDEIIDEALAIITKVDKIGKPLRRKVWVPVDFNVGGPALDLNNIRPEWSRAKESGSGSPVRAVVVVAREDWTEIRKKWKKHNG